MHIISVHDNNDFADILDYIHDREFNLSDIVFDSQKSILIIPTTVREYKTIRKGNSSLLFKKYIVPVFKATLIIMNVVNYNIFDSEHIETYAFNILRFKDDILTINAVPCLKISVEIQGLNIELRIDDERVLKEIQFYSIF